MGISRRTGECGGGIHRSAVGPVIRYFAAVDGTEAVDSMVFCKLLMEHAGWKDLLHTFLRPDPEDPERLVDPKHKFLPICLHDRHPKIATGPGVVAVVSPGGRDSLGRDTFWKKYKDPHGRLTAATESARYMQDFILRPQVEVIPGSPHIATLRDPTPTEGARRIAADLLYVSSHGWLGGFARGNVIPGWEEAEPEEARVELHPRPHYFSVGDYANRSVGFEGPRWIVLAQCSTANSSTWPLWARVLARSFPRVRGILAYEEASPDATRSVEVAQRFFLSLNRTTRAGTKTTILDAWRAANPAYRWAAIVHKAALEDTLDDFLDDFATKPPIRGAETTDSVANYRGFTSDARDTKDIFDIRPPFGLRLEVAVGTSYVEISSANVADWTVARYDPGRRYKLTVTAPHYHSVMRAVVTWVHIRESHGLKPKIDDLFATVTSGDATARILRGSRTLTITPMAASQSSVTVELTALQEPRIELGPHHSYLWPIVELTTNTRYDKHNFATTGLSYYGRRR